MKLSDFDYELPAGCIAQQPLGRRDASRLMVVRPGGGAVEHRRFAELPGLLAAGDLLVVNDTRVFPARLEARKPTGGRVEVLLLERRGGEPEAPRFAAMLRASHAPAPGSRLEFDGDLTAEILEREAERFLLAFRSERGSAAERLERLGRPPLPPYIRRETEDPRDGVDRERYQTVYAARPGAVAAPTAGLHFTPDLLAALGRRGVRTARLTLHVGPGTFRPVRCERVEDHVMHDEWFELPESTAEAIRHTRGRGGRVVAVGTTVVRTLEHRAVGDGTVEPGTGRCGLFIRPGFRFRVVDDLITNFHLPRSTLLMLVSAFAGRETVLAAYAEAIREGYRFYSYGDAMMVRSR
jgi:S-adenosylmethionine:tRNA ribosyltransferase-isomerase